MYIFHYQHMEDSCMVHVEDTLMLYFNVIVIEHQVPAI